jgi:hypothetical protein
VFPPLALIVSIVNARAEDTATDEAANAVAAANTASVAKRSCVKRSVMVPPFPTFIAPKQ